MERIIVDGVNREMTQAELDLTLANRPNPRIAEIAKRQQEIIQELKQLDYKSIKRIQGNYTEAEWDLHVAYCDTLRNEYNDLGLELATL
jgi:hypothetical protein